MITGKRKKYGKPNRQDKGQEEILNRKGINMNTVKNKTHKQKREHFAKIKSQNIEMISDQNFNNILFTWKTIKWLDY